MLVSEYDGLEYMTFTYSPSGEPVGLSVRDEETNEIVEYYFYLKNLQGDIIGLLDYQGELRYTYSYDAWGKLLGIYDRNRNEVTHPNHIAVRNPLRYRGYYYDTETGLYYLNSRYYNPEWGTFICADGYLSTGEQIVAKNMYAYCLNNPVNMSDNEGTVPKWATKVAIGVGGIVLGAAVVAATVATGGVATAFLGAAVAGLKTAAISGVVAAGTSSVVAVVKSLETGDDLKSTIQKTVNSAVNGFADGFMYGGLNFGVWRAAGYVTQKTGIFTRNITYKKNNFMFGKKDLTIWKHGNNFRVDASVSLGLHYHWRTSATGIGVHRTQWISTILGVISGILSAISK